jgi:MFS family permease
MDDNHFRNFCGMGAIKARNKMSFATRILLSLVVVTLIITGTHLLFQYLNLVVFYQQVGQFYELSNRFDLDDESSVPTWFAQALFLTIAASAFLAGYLQTSRPARRIWWLIATVGLIFSLDEISALHERILQTLHVTVFQDASPTGLANAWLIVFPFVLLFSAWLIWKMLHLLPPRTIFLFVFGGFVFLAGAVVADLLTSIAPRETFLNQGVFVAIEETLELLGAIIGLYAIVNYLETHHQPAISKAIKSLKPNR